MVSINSTLVETVSINYEDFNESFLTCGTCLCIYDGADHIPKLLPCSHTVCLHCLTRIAASHSREIGAFRCPICRELISIPRGGIPALPPSFLVNQLLDLMSRQTRHIIPKCSVHINQELLFCETCDLIFCSLCSSGASHNTVSMLAAANNCEHTIVPFSIAIKRMSEILLYKANECLSKLAKAKESVSKELEKLEMTTRECLQNLDKSFQDIIQLLNRRKSELVQVIECTKLNKHKILEEQLTLIEGEKQKVEQVCDGLQYQMEVRNISQRISSLSGKLDNVSILVDPRENCYIKCDISHDDKLQPLKRIISSLGKVVTSTTFPSLSSLHVKDKYVVNLEAVAIVKTVDYHGNPRTTGGDPVSVVLHRVCESELTAVKTDIVDPDDGTYYIKFRPSVIGSYCLKVNVLGRQIKNGICHFWVTEHNNPVCAHGSRGSGKEEYLQPVAVAVDNYQNLVYVMDTGNSRIKVLSGDLEFIRHINNPGLLGRSCTGIAVFPAGEKHDSWLVVVNWRTKIITRMDTDGETLSNFTHSFFHEPISVAVNPIDGHILVADNGTSCIFVFSCDGELLFQFGEKGCQRGNFNLISAVCVGNSKEIIVSDSRIQVFSADGIVQKEIFSESGTLYRYGQYGGVGVDNNGLIVACRTEKTRHYLQVFDMNGKVINAIDSYEDRLRRPCGLAITNDRHVIVVDLGNDMIKKYCYW